MKTTRSRQLYRRAREKIPGAVNSPVRAWKAVGGVPRFIRRGKGAHIVDVDGNDYIDFLGSWGPLILGHAHPRVLAAIRSAAAKGTTFGAPTEQELKLATLVSELMPSIKMLRLVSSGTEATMSALRLARAFTQRSRIVKFDGCYHGHADGLLSKAGSGVATLGLPDSPGVIPAVAAETLVARYNDTAAVEAVFQRYGDTIAAVIVEPVCGNMGVIPADPAFLSQLRSTTRAYGSLLIFDEVITGFRVAIGGAQELYKITPDLTCLGKILGGGLPLAGFGGSEEIMTLLAPEGPVYQAGTLSGNPLAVSAGLSTLNCLSNPDTYRDLEKKAAVLERGFARIFEQYGITGAINRVGSMMTVFFGVLAVRDADEARRCDREQFARFFHGMLERGIYLPPAPFEALMISLAHSSTDLRTAVAACEAWAAAETRVDASGPSC